MHNTLFSIVTHLGGSVLFIVNFCYCLLTAFKCKTFTFCKCDYRYRDVLDNQDNFVANIKIYFLALPYTPSSS